MKRALIITLSSTFLLIFLLYICSLIRNYVIKGRNPEIPDVVDVIILFIVISIWSIFTYLITRRIVRSS